MKKIFAIASLALLTSTVWAHDKVLSGNPDLYNSPLLDHTTNKSQSRQSTAVQPGIGDSASQFGRDTSNRMNLDHDDWADFNNSEVYGSY